MIATNGKVSALNYEDRSTGKKHGKNLDGVFVQIGLLPNSGFIQEQVETTPQGEIMIDKKCRTSSEGIFACGDVTKVPFKQIVISMSEGAKASLSAFEYLLTLVDDEQKDQAP